MSSASKMDRMEGDCLLGKMESKMYLADFSCFLAKFRSSRIAAPVSYYVTSMVTSYTCYIYRDLQHAFSFNAGIFIINAET